MIPHVLSRFRACLHEPSWLTLPRWLARSRKRKIWGQECWPARGHLIMFTEAVCMSSVLPSCCWLVRQAGPLSMENFLWPGQPGSRHHSTDTLNSTNYYCYVLSKPASKTLIQINSDSCTNVFSRGVNKPTTQQTSHANDFVNVKSHAGNKPPISSQSIFFLKRWCCLGTVYLYLQEGRNLRFF